jgi:predicted enzyme related to lactoylglutathione lyase
MSKHGSFVWNELNSWDPEAAKRFYGETLGWSFDAMPMPNGTYWIAKMGDEMVAGIFPLHSPDFDGIPSHWLPYIEVDDIDERLKGVAAAGGGIIRPAFDVPGIGRIAIVMDAEGAGHGWITSVAPDK